MAVVLQDGQGVIAIQVGILHGRHINKYCNKKYRRMHIFENLWTSAIRVVIIRNQISCLILLS